MKICIFEKESTTITLKDKLDSMTDTELNSQLIAIFKYFYLNNKKINDITYKEKARLTLFVEKMMEKGELETLNNFLFNKKISNINNDHFDNHKYKGYIHKSGENNYFAMINYLYNSNILCGVDFIQHYSSDFRCQITHFLSKDYFIPYDMPENKSGFYLFYLLFLLSKQQSLKINAAIDVFSEEDNSSLRNIANLDMPFKKMLFKDIFYMGKEKKNHSVLKKLIEECGLNNNMANDIEYITTFTFFRTLYIHEEYKVDFNNLEERMKNYFGFIEEQFGDILPFKDKIIEQNIYALLFYGTNPFACEGLTGLKNHFKVDYSELFDMAINQVINNSSTLSESKKEFLLSMLTTFSEESFSINLLFAIQNIKQFGFTKDNNETENMLEALKVDIINNDKNVLNENINIPVIQNRTVNKLKTRL